MLRISSIFSKSATLFHDSICTVITTSMCSGRYGHRLVKLWEYKEYVTHPIKVWRTGGRVPNGSNKLPGKKWTSRIGGGLERQWFWVAHSRLTLEEILHEKFFCERVIEIKLDDNRSGYIALVAGPLTRRWILATDEMKVGDIIKTSAKPDSGLFSGRSGDAFPLKLIPVGTEVCSVENCPGKGAQIARSAGNSCTVLRKNKFNVIIALPSGREASVHPDCMAVIGRVSNVDHDQEVWGSAQQSRDYGVRPHSGKWYRKDGRHGKKIRPKKPMILYQDAKIFKEKQLLED